MVLGWVALAIYYMVIDSHDNVMECLMLAVIVLLMGIYEGRR